MGTKKNGASEGNTRGEKELPLPSRVSLSRRVLFCAVTFKRLLRRLSLILIFCLQNLLFIYLFGKKLRTILSYFCFVFAGSLNGSYWASERLLDDIMIRKFVEGVLHDFLKSEVVIKRKANRINLVFILSKEGDLTKFYFLVGFTEKLLSELLGCVVKIEPQSAF